MVKDIEWFKNIEKKQKKKEDKPLKLAKEGLELAGGIIILSAGAKALKEVFD